MDNRPWTFNPLVLGSNPSGGTSVDREASTGDFGLRRKLPASNRLALWNGTTLFPHDGLVSAPEAASVAQLARVARIAVSIASTEGNTAASNGGL